MRFLTCKRFFGSATVGAVSERFCQPYWTLDTGWAVDFFLGEIIVTELKELLQAVGIMDHESR